MAFHQAKYKRISFKSVEQYWNFIAEHGYECYLDYNKLYQDLAQAVPTQNLCFLPMESLFNSEKNTLKYFSDFINVDEKKLIKLIKKCRISNKTSYDKRSSSKAWLKFPRTKYPPKEFNSELPQPIKAIIADSYRNSNSLLAARISQGNEIYKDYF